MTSSRERQTLGPNASVLLDGLRFAAALAVAFTHLPLFYHGRLLLDERAGNTAVCVFFVLSGFVIRFVTLYRAQTGRTYALDRASRLYSVVLPALLLTVALEAGSFFLAPAAYHRVSTPYLWRDVPGQMLGSLTFTAGWWGQGLPPLSNGAFWSLTFEAVYYALYGFLLFLPRGRWIAVPLLLLFAGPAIALLFPVWLLGAALYDVYVRLRSRQGVLLPATLPLAAYLALLLLFHRQVLGWLQRTDVVGRTAALTHLVGHLPWGQALFHGQPLHWLDRLSTSFYLTGTLLAVALLPLLLLLDRPNALPAIPPAAAKRIRLVADSTFALYLLHLPLLLFAASLTGGPWRSLHAALGALLVVVVLCVGLASVFDSFKDLLRRGVSRRSEAGLRAGHTAPHAHTPQRHG